MRVKELFGGVYTVDGKLATANLSKGTRVYNEELVSHGDTEYRLWNPYRSKLAAAIINGLRTFSIRDDSRVLYLGAATGTTASHVSDITSKGQVFCVEFSERNMRELLKTCEHRPNMLPLLCDANNTEEYEDAVKECDVIYQDVSARNQAEILDKNGAMLKRGGTAYFVIKSQSIDISKRPEQVFKEALEGVSKRFDVVEKIDIEPFDSLHMFAVLKKR